MLIVILIGSLIWYNCRKEVYDLEEVEMMTKKEAEKENPMKVTDPEEAEMFHTSSHSYINTNNTNTIPSQSITNNYENGQIHCSKPVFV